MTLNTIRAKNIAVRKFIYRRQDSNIGSNTCGCYGILSHVNSGSAIGSFSIVEYDAFKNYRLPKNMLSDVRCL